MILVDTSVWIDHLHRSDADLVALLERDEVATHALVIEELALGRIAQRALVLDMLESLRRLPELDHGELSGLVERWELWGRGLSTVDAHLLGAVLITPGASLWSRDRRLLSACAKVGAPVFSA
ncbi:type II toxin-antitoxin system VapC family toxin [Microbacterium gorillae]|uniref:type II toxin-antitoxin system VapC family toxin n=1 Tax=Microbacterium gorillae TaxID=1231063 RepID=UPI003D99F455